MSFLGNLSLGSIRAGAGRTYWPQVGVEKVGCYPDRVEDRAPGRYIQLTGNLQNSLHIAFPKGFFDYQKQELVRLRSRPPQVPDNTDHKVFWALDVWARINWMLFSLNIPLGPYNIQNSAGGSCNSWLGGCAGPGWVMPNNPLMQELSDKIADYGRGVTLARDNRSRALDFEFGNQFMRDRIQDSPARPSAFMELVPQWYGTRGRFDASVAYNNNLRFVVERDCIPWMVGGDKLPSKGGKDNDFVAANANNPGVLRAVRQWRLLSYGIDYWPWDEYDSMNDKSDTDDRLDYDNAPRFMGKINRRDTLEDYLRRVKTEPSAAEVVGTENGWYPTLQYVIAYGLPRLIDVMTSTDYEETVRTHVEAWANVAKPPFDANGNLKTFNAGPRWGTRPEPLPLTCEDFNDAVKGRKDALEARAHNAVENPRATCASADSDYSRKACEGLNDMNSWLGEEFPVTSWMFDMGRYIGHFMFEIGGVAEGVSGPSGMRVMHNPFTRNLADPVFDTAATGSTKDVLIRITNSLLNIETQLGLQLEPWTMGPPPPPARTKCDEQRLDSKGVARCVSTVTGDCYEVYFDQHGEAQCLSRYTPDEWGAALATHLDPVTACRDSLNSYLDEQNATFTGDQRTTAMSMCQRELAGNLPPGTAVNYVLEEVAAQKRRMDMPLVTVPSSPSIPWGLLAVAAVGVVLYKRSN